MSAPSGAGKTTLCKAVRRKFKDLAYSVSFTTRSAREGERNGKDYFFISRVEFEEGINTGRWAEWAEVHGNYYGTSAQWVKGTLAKGRSILMDIDVAGTRQMIERFPRAETIFIMPPSLEELECRLRKRGTDSKETIRVRLKNAQMEIVEKGWYRHLIVNDDLDQAAQRLMALMSACFNQGPVCDPVA
jgi:guanylate kinase